MLAIAGVPIMFISNAVFSGSRLECESYELLSRPLPSAAFCSCDVTIFVLINATGFSKKNKRKKQFMRLVGDEMQLNYTRSISNCKLFDVCTMLNICKEFGQIYGKCHL